MKVTDKDPIPKDPFNRDKFKTAISWVESSGGKALTNKTSSAAGKYHFLYRYLKNIPELKGYSKMDFVNDDAMQEKIMDMALDGKLQGFPNYIAHSAKLKKEYGSNLRQEEIAALTHFLGGTGVRKYLKNKSYKVPGENATVDQYLGRFRSSFGEVDATIPANPLKPVKDIPVQQKDNIPQIPVPEQKKAQQQTVIPGGTEFLKSSYNGTKENDVISFLQNAYGGQVPGQSDGELQRFDEGGTHEENPYGGIPIGMNQSGQMNTVEEGETKIDLDDGEYVFSNRIGMQSAYNKK